MYRRVLLSALSSVALVSAAFAADIYSPGPASYAPVAFPPSWGGFYLGVNGGYGGDSSQGFSDNVTYTGTPPGPYAAVDGKDIITGGFGGGQLGYNWQFGGWVVGFETDIQGSNIMGSGEQAYLTAPAAASSNFCGAAVGGGLAGRYPCGARNDLDVDWFGTVRGRLGWAFGGTLLYVTGGFAYGGVAESASYNDSITSSGTATPLNRARISSSTTQTGWAAGAGIEQKITPSWSVKGEYQFVYLGSVSAGPGPLNNIQGATPIPVTGFLARSDSRLEFNTVRIGINYLFNAPEPLPLK